MTLKPYEDLLDQISPRHYKQFRLLYNELLGYIERDEFDKIKAFSKRLDAALQQTLQIQVALDRRLQNFKRQQNISLKQDVYRRFRQPKKTIPVTHPFPLKYAPIVPTRPIKDTAEPADTLAKERQLDSLMDEMAEFNQSNQVDTTVSGDVKAASTVDNLLASSDDADSTPAVQINDVVSEPNDVVEDGVSLSDDLEDQSLYIKKKKSKDVLRAKKAAKEKNNKPKGNQAKPRKQPPLTDKERKARIWDYIDNDSSTGGIDHDL